MMRIYELALKDLLQVLRDRMSFVFLLVMPLVFTLFMGYMFKGASQPSDPRLPLGWVNQDSGGALSRTLQASLEASGSLRLVALAPGAVESAHQQVQSGKLAGALIVPPDFSRLALSGDDPQLNLVVDEYTTTGQSVLQLVRAPVTRLMSAVEIARIAVGARGGGDHSALEAAFAEASQAWQEAAQAGPQISLVKAQAQPESEPSLTGANPYNQVSPGMLVQFAIFGLIMSSSVIVMERKTRTLQRLLTTSMRRWEIIAGHTLAMFVLVFLQGVLLIVFGQFFLKVDYFRAPAAILLVMTAMALWCASLGLLIGVLARDEHQAVLLGMAAMFIFTALAGAWFPLESSGQAFALIGRLTPGAWAMNGFQNILVRGLGVASTLWPAAVLAIYALGFLGLAVWRFREA